MNRVIRSKPMVLVLISMLLTSLFTVIGPNEISANGTTYYIDSVDGDDNNSGTSPDSAWKSLDKVNNTTFQPGDSILFKAGGVWTGTLHPLGSGTPEQMITIGMYDTGALPRIQGAGAARAVYLYNQEYWDIGFLEVTNYGSSSATAPRVGVQVVGEDYQAGAATDIENVAVLHNIRIHDLYVHDVNGQVRARARAYVFMSRSVRGQSFRRPNLMAFTLRTMWSRMSSGRGLPHPRLGAIVSCCKAAGSMPASHGFR